LAITRHETWRSWRRSRMLCQWGTKWQQIHHAMQLGACYGYDLLHVDSYIPLPLIIPLQVVRHFVSLLAFSLIFIIIKPQWLINSIYSSPTFKLVNISGNFIDIYRVCVCVCFVRFVKDIYDHVISKCSLSIQILCAQKSETQYAWFARMARICDMQPWFFISRAELPLLWEGSLHPRSLKKNPLFNSWTWVFFIIVKHFARLKI